MGYYISNATNNTAKSGGSHKDLRQAIWAVYYHKISTNKKPDHRFCPDGKESWCHFKRAVAEKTVKVRFYA